MTDLLTPQTIRGMQDSIRDANWPYEKLEQLCWDYLTLWDRYENMREQRDNLEGRLGILSGNGDD